MVGLDTPSYSGIAAGGPAFPHTEWPLEPRQRQSSGLKKQCQADMAQDGGWLLFVFETDHSADGGLHK